MLKALLMFFLQQFFYFYFPFVNLHVNLRFRVKHLKFKLLERSGESERVFIFRR